MLSFYLDGNKKAQARKYKKEGLENIILDPIVAIEERGKDLTYDIHVESENHNFIANGIVVHNSWLEPGRKIFKSYMMLEDAAVTHRSIFPKLCKWIDEIAANSLWFKPRESRIRLT